MSLVSRKAAAYLLVCALVFAAVLSGCTTSSSSGGTTTVPSTSPPSSAPTDAAPENEEPEKPLEISMMLALFDEVDDMNNEIWTEYQKRMNVKLNIEWVPSGDYDTKFDLVLASGNLPDVIFSSQVNRPTLLKAFDNGAFWDLTPFLGDFSNYPNLKQYSSPTAWRYVTKDGKITGAPRNRPYIDQGIKLRKDWLDKLGLPIPQTMDEYADTLVAMVEGDPDGNGKKDTLGYVHPGGTGIPGSFVAAFGGLKPHYTSDGSGLIHTNLNEGYTDTVEFMRNLYARGGLPQEFATMKATQAQELFESGQAASYIRNIWRAWMFQESIKKVQPDGEVIIISPTGPKGDPAIQLALDTYGGLYISKNVPEEKVKQILDYWERSNTPEMFDLIFFGIPGVHYNEVNGYKEMTELGGKQIGTSIQQPHPLPFNEWWKSYDKTAPKEYNDRIWEQVKEFDKRGFLDPFAYLTSDTWTETWPKFSSEWTEMVVQAITGNITMDEYKDYVAGLHAKPEFQKAFQEFKVNYDNFWE